MPPIHRGHWARHLTTAPAVAVVVAATTAAAAPAIQPVIARDFPDPAVIAVGSNYYAYSTGSSYNSKVWHIPVQRSSSLTGKWTELGDALPQLPEWVAKDGVGHGNVWAPEIAARSDGSYILYFTARAAAQNVQCIGVALASSPRGPFKPVGNKPLVCRPEDVDSIDPKAFTDSDGKQYLLYTSGRGNATIWLQQVSADGMTAIGDRRALIKADRPEEGNIVEAPTLVRHNGRYVLFYSGNAFNSGRYFVNYATAASLAGPFVKRPGQFLNRDTFGGAFNNPGGQDVIPGSKNDYLVFHAYAAPNQRAMFVAGLTWDASGNPSLLLDNVAKAASRGGEASRASRTSTDANRYNTDKAAAATKPAPAPAAARTRPETAGAGHANAGRSTGAARETSASRDTGAARDTGAGADSEPGDSTANSPADRDDEDTTE